MTGQQPFGLRVYANNELAYAQSVSSVPEPESYAMLLAGLGLVAGIARRKQK